MILVISPAYGNKPNTEKLIKAAASRRIKVEVAFNSLDLDKIKKQQYVALYGEHAFCEYVAQETKRILHSNCLDWITKIPTPCVKRDVKYMTIEDAKILSTEILGKKVIEPADNPCFVKGIHTESLPDVPDQTPILVSQEQEWAVKYRFVIIDNRIVTHTCYQLVNAVTKPETIASCDYTDSFTGLNAVSFIQTVLTRCKAAPACIIDAGYIKGIGWSIIGTYPIWASDPLTCDPDKFLQGLFVACQTV